MFETPILDLEQPWPTRKRGWRTWAVAIAIGLAIGWGLPWSADNVFPLLNLPGFNGLLLIPAFYAAIVIHELGHAAAARMVGLESGGIWIGPLAIARSGDRWIMRFERRRWSGGLFRPLVGAAGVSAARFGIMVAGGPGANLLSAVAGTLIWARYGNGTWTWNGTFFWCSVLALLLSMIPASAGALKSDGARLWQLFRYPELWPSFAAVLSIQSDEARGVRPRDWNPELWVMAAAIDSTVGEYGAVQLYAFYRALDQGEHAIALMHLENALAHSARAPRQFRHALALEAACSSGFVRANAEQAKQWLDRARAIAKKSPDYVAQAAIAMSESRYDDALRQFDAARKRVQKLNVDSGLVRFALEKWAEYEEQCRRHLVMAEAAKSGGMT